jgi:hypothetical protein
VVVTIVFALSPVNGLMTVTLWKDVAYSCVLLGLLLILLRAVHTGGEWLGSRGGVAAVVAALAALALLRHNVLFVVAQILLGLLATWPRRWRRTARAAVLTLLVVWLVRGPLEAALGVQPMTRYFMLANQTHQIAAILHNGADPTPRQAALLSAIMPIEEWRGSYNCYSVMPTFLNGMVTGTQVVDDRMRQYVRVYLQLVREHPRAMLKRQACISSLVWRVGHPPGSPFFAFYPGIVEIPEGPRSDPKLPTLRAELLRLAAWTLDERRVALFWRPAGYLYLTIACVGVLVWRTRRAAAWALLLPSAAQSLVLLLLNTVQDFRLQYGVYLIALVALALPFARPLLPDVPAAVGELGLARSLEPPDEGRVGGGRVGAA